jgi:hypothetical protein
MSIVRFRCRATSNNLSENIVDAVASAGKYDEYVLNSVSFQFIVLSLAFLGKKRKKYHYKYAVMENGINLQSNYDLWGKLVENIS